MDSLCSNFVPISIYGTNVAIKHRLLLITSSELCYCKSSATSVSLPFVSTDNVSAFAGVCFESDCPH